MDLVFFVFGWIHPGAWPPDWFFCVSGGYTQEPGPLPAHGRKCQSIGRYPSKVPKILGVYENWVDTPRSLARGHFLFRVDTPRSLVLFQLLAVVNTFQRQPPIGVRVFSLGVYELPFRVDKPRSLAPRLVFLCFGWIHPGARQPPSVWKPSQ